MMGNLQFANAVISWTARGNTDFPHSEGVWSESESSL